jgi:hypothetical protein
MRKALCAFVFVFVAAQFPAAAQTVTGTILGSVLDATGAVIPAAKVTVTSAGTGFTRTVEADEVGNYLVTFLPLGSYEVVALAPGFKQTRRPGITVAADERVRVDLTLQVGDATQTVEVTAGAPLVQTSDATVGEVVNSQQITDFPLNKRNFADLVQLTSGVSPGRAGEFGGETTIDNFRGRFTFNASGQRSTTNNFILDGVDNNANLFNAGGVVIAPVVDAIQEFKVSTANFSPEFGRAVGGVVSVQTKAGTNALHGTVFEFLRNSALDANTFFNNRAGVEKPPFRQNQFGFTVGGPIRRDKTFFFGDYQGFRVRDTRSFLASVPTAAAKQGDFSGPLYQRIYDPSTARPDGANIRLDPFPNNRVPLNRQDPIAIEASGLYPEPNTNLGGITSNFINNPNLTRTDDQFDIRIDHRVSESGNFFARYSFGDAEQLWPNALLSASNPFGGGGKGNLSIVRAQSLALNYIQSITPRLLSETRLGFTRTLYIGNPLGYGDPAFEAFQMPNLRYTDRVQMVPTFGITRLTGIGPQANVPNTSVQNNFQVSQNLVYSVGSIHTLKMGGDIIRRQLNNDFTGSPSGSFSFSGAYTNVNARPATNGGEPYADFLLGLYASSTRDILLGGFGRRGTIGSWYFQDDMKLSRRLTVNLGIRWDVWTPLYEVNDRQATFDPGLRRLVIAGEDGPLGRGLRGTDWNNYAPRFGFAYDLTGSGRTVLRGGYSMSFIEDLSAGRTILPLNPPFAFSDQIVHSQGIIPTRTLQQGFNPPIIPDVEQNLSGQLRSVDAGYRSAYAQTWSFGVQRELASNLALDVSYVGSKGTRLMERVDLNQPPAGPGAVNTRRPFYSLYPNVTTIDGLLSTGNSTYHSFQFKLTRRFANGLHFLTTYTNGRAIEGTEGVGETGVGAPVPTRAQDPNNRAAEKALASYHMQQRLIFSYGYELPFGRSKRFATSGVAALVLGGWSIQGITSLLDGNPFSVQMSSNNLNNGGFQRPDRICDGSLPRSERSVNRYFDTACFVAPALYAYGNAGRNILIGPGAVNFDTAVLRDFTIKEGVRLQFRAEFFNFFNTPQFYPPNASIGSPDAGTISGVRGGSNRQSQLGLKLIY